MEPTRTTYMHLPQWQIVLFYVLITLSLLAMAWQILDRVRVWRRGKPIDWKPDYLGGVWRYVLGQKKVQGSRPKSGAPMHLMIFYGFLGLTLATTLLAIAEYGPVKFHRGTYFLAYEVTFDIIGFVFLIGVAWAFGRRWNTIRRQGLPSIDGTTGKPAWSRNPLSHEPGDFAALGLLFALGITGFVLEGARMANDPKPFDWSAPVGNLVRGWLGTVTAAGYVTIWWIHAFLVMALFVTLPKMRLRHIVMATFSAAGNPERSMGALEPISLAEVEKTGLIGVAEAKDYSRWHLMSLDACMSCGRCTEVCPAYGVGKILNPKQVVADVRQAAEAGGQVAAGVTEEALWACTTCNACVEACPVLIRHVDLIVDARRNLVAEGRLSGSGATMLRQVGSTGNAWGAPASGREDWMKGLDIPLCRDGAPFEYLFWVGCAGATDPGAVKTTKAVAALLKKAGVSFACLGQEEACTGDPARRIGDEFTWQGMAEQNVSVFQRYGVRKVVTACPHCFNTFKNEYSQAGGVLEVFHHTQLLDQLVKAGDIKAAQPEKGSVTYHDPCYLARINDESDAPRALVGQETHWNGDASAIVRALAKEPDGPAVLAEPEHKGRKTLCCGAGGGRMWMDEDPSQRPANRRAEELLATGADRVAVACPFCRIMLDTGLKAATDQDVQLVDLAELVLEANSE